MEVIALQDILSCERGPILLLVFAKNYDAKNGHIFVRVGRESARNEGTVFSTSFQREHQLVRLPFVERYAVAVRLNTGYRTTYVEVLDTSTDTSCVYVLRHGEFFNPYKVNESRETTIQVTMNNSDEASKSETPKFQFLADAFDLTDVTTPAVDIHITEEEKKVVDPVDPLLKAEAEYRSHQVVFQENQKASMITGVYWNGEAHWSSCNDEILIAPLAKSLFPVKAAANMPLFLRQLHMAYVSALSQGVCYDAPLPDNIPDHIFFPHLPLLESSSLKSLYNNVKEETLQALTMVYSDIVFPLLAKEEFLDGALLTTRKGIYATDQKDVVGNPLSPWLNEHVRRRWGLEEYVRHRLYLGKTYALGNRQRDWGRFSVRGGVIVGISHPTGQTYGDDGYDTGPLQMLRVELKRIEEMAWQCCEWNDDALRRVSGYADKAIVQGLGKSPCYVCYYNAVTGHMYASHPLFPPGKCVAFICNPLTQKEIKLLLCHVKESAASLARYYVIKTV